MSNETPEPQPDANGGEKQRLRNILTNLLATVTSLAGISSIAVILSMLFVYIYAGTSKDTMGIASIEYARGMITLLFAVGTVVIALLLTLSAIFPSNENSDDKAKQRFDRGKEVLSLLIGILGTIIGFYFGSISQKAEQATAATTPQQINEARVPANEPSVDNVVLGKPEQPTELGSATR